MRTIEAEIVARMEQLKVKTYSDFVILGMIDSGKRELHWSNSAGSISERTLLVRQKPSSGLSGAAIRSGRIASTNTALTDSERFKLGEPILLTERLKTAASVPILTRVTPIRVVGVLLIGRRTEQLYRTEELDEASQITEQLATMLV